MMMSADALSLDDSLNPMPTVEIYAQSIQWSLVLLTVASLSFVCWMYPAPNDLPEPEPEEELREELVGVETGFHKINVPMQMH